ncbi:MAG: hypothetical protein IPH36_22185 [Saprospiraceae bacterium]|nr:hypothetical protein [Saprospiraceae bacterium]
MAAFDLPKSKFFPSIDRLLLKSFYLFQHLGAFSGIKFLISLLNVSDVLMRVPIKPSFVVHFKKNSLTLLYEIGLSDDYFCFTSFQNIPLID